MEIQSIVLEEKKEKINLNLDLYVKESTYT